MSNFVPNKEYKNKNDIAIDTILDMITQRGYKVAEKDENIIVVRGNKEDIVIFKEPVVKFNVDKIKEYTSIMYKMGLKHCICIYIDSITPPTKKLIDNSIDMKIEIFTQDELQYNITNHRLVPLHTRLSPTEAKEFKKQYGNKFMSMLVSDPVSRFYNYQKGDVIKITRKSDKGDMIYYRIVK